MVFLEMHLSQYKVRDINVECTLFRVLTGTREQGLKSNFVSRNRQITWKMRIVQFKKIFFERLKKGEDTGREGREC